MRCSARNPRSSRTVAVGGMMATKSPLERSRVTINIASSFTGSPLVVAPCAPPCSPSCSRSGSPPACPRLRTVAERATPGQCAQDGHPRVPRRHRRRRPADPPAVHRVARRRSADARDPVVRRPPPGPAADRVVLPLLRDAGVVARLLLLLRHCAGTQPFRAPASTGGVARSTSRTTSASSPSVPPPTTG